MAADAYKGVVTLEYVRPTKGGWQRTGQTQQFSFSADDVAGNKLTFDGTGATDFILPMPAVVTDISTTEDGADTTRLELFLNGMQTAYTWLIANLLNTVPQPHILPGARPIIPAGVRAQVFQRA